MAGEGKEPPNKNTIKKCWDAITLALYNDSKNKKKLVHDAVRYYADVYVKGVWDGYGNNGIIDYGTPDGHMQEALLNNCYFFAEAKTRTQLRTLTQGIINPANGQIRSIAEFKKFAHEITGSHVDSWLKAEYNLAINCAQMSSRWVDIQKDKQLFPQLEFDAVIDERTTDKCRNFDGKVFAVDDPVWNIIYPPNHWGCRSLVRKVSGRKLDDSSTLNTDSVKDGFRSNMAKDGMPWPKDSAYFKADDYSTIEGKLGNASFKLVDRPGRKGTVFESGINIKKPYELVENKQEAANRYIAADAMAQELERTFFINPEIKYYDFRHSFYFKGALENKSPDLFDGEEFWEVCMYGRNAHSKIKQAKNIIILLKNNHNPKQAVNKVTNELNGKSNFAQKAKRVYIVDVEGKVIKIR